MNFNLDRQLKDDELRIIGVEFNIIMPNGNITEMAMFVPNGNGLVIPPGIQCQQAWRLLFAAELPTAGNIPFYRR